DRGAHTPSLPDGAADQAAVRGARLLARPGARGCGSLSPSGKVIRVRSHGGPAAAKEARLPEALTSLERPALEDDTAWDGVLVTGDVAIRGAPDHVEMEGSRGRGLRLTGCELGHLRATDVVFEHCEFSG